MEITIKHREAEMLIVGAFRYAVGRRSYVVGEMCDWLVFNWSELSSNTKHIIERDLEGEFERDDQARSASRDVKPLGDDCDRSSWERVRALYHHDADETVRNK